MSDGNKPNILDKWNFAITVLVVVICPVCWLLISQKIDLKVNTLESSDKDTYVDQTTYRSDKTEEWKKIGEQEDHLDTVDSRENSDKSAEDLKIQSLQDMSRKQLSSVADATQATNQPVQ